jgi:hypothetical protein
VAVNGDLPFDTLAVTPVGITTDAGHTAFTVSDAGTYLLIVLPLGSGSPGAYKAQLTVNNSPLGPTNPGAFTFSRILNLGAGDVVTVRNVGTGTAVEGLGAEITIVRIS